MNFLTAILDTPEKRKAYFTELSTEVKLRNHALWQYVPNSLLAYFAGKVNDLEPELLDWIEAIPEGSVMYDLGASTGLYSLYAAINKVNVFSFEPDVLNYSILEINRFLNEDKLVGSMCSYNLAVSDATCRSEMHAGRFQFGAHNKILGKAEVREGGQFYRPEHIQSVLQVSLSEAVNQFGFPSPEYIKIDIDGAELAALHGLKGVLNGVQSIFIELSESNADTSDVIALLENEGFKETQRFNVVKPDGGYYEGLYNVIFARC